MLSVVAAVACQIGSLLGNFVLSLLVSFQIVTSHTQNCFACRCSILVVVGVFNLSDDIILFVVMLCHICQPFQLLLLCYA